MTVNVAVCPSITVWLAGCGVMDALVGLVPPLGVLELATPAQPTEERVARIAARKTIRRLARTCRRTRTPQSKRFACMPWAAACCGANRYMPDPTARHWLVVGLWVGR